MIKYCKTVLRSLTAPLIEHLRPPVRCESSFQFKIKKRGVA